jgi:AcrR family transcriptional regulator
MESKRSRGRPRQYDPQQALAAALGEFRRRGYTATSLDHLSEATKMARPSLYAAFGGKLDIYRQAVRQFADESGARRTHALFDEPSLHKGLEAYFGEIVDAYVTREGEPLGCPILSVISGEAAADPEIGAELAAAVEKTDAQFQRRMRMAADAGEISADADVAGVAAMLAALQHSLSLRARAGERRPKLLRIARSHIALALKAAGYGGFTARSS